MTPRLYLTPEAIERLTIRAEPWFSCDDCFELVDVAVECLLTAAVPISVGFGAHLLGCTACREETETLVSLVAPDLDGDADVALAVLG
jgi:hypothetical protein